MKTTRRNFLKVAAGATAVGAACGGIAVPEVQAAAERSFGPDTVTKMYDSTLCVGCQACVVACYRTNFAERASFVEKYLPASEQNFIEREDLIPKLTEGDEYDPNRPWLNVTTLDYRLRTVIQKFVDGDKKTHFIKKNCMHCLHPGCVSACPVKAMVRDEETGVVTYDANKCVGCRYCQMACPFNVPKFEWHRAVPKIVKCDMCYTTLGLNNMPGTACANTCPQKAVVYGKRSDLLAEAKKRVADNPGKYYKDMVLGEKIYGGTGELVLASVDFTKLGIPTDKIADYSYAGKSEGLQHTIYKWGIAPIALYTALAIVISKNSKNHHDGEGK